MINSRSLDDLLPQVHVRAEKLIMLCKDAGIDLLVTSTYRDKEAQDALYAQGRTKPGKIVTKAKGGESFHNYRCAFDVVPLINGKPVWDDTNPIWAEVSRFAKIVGLDWAGDWKTFREAPHFQYTGGKTLKQLQAGERIV